MSRGMVSWMDYDEERKLLLTVSRDNIMKIWNIENILQENNIFKLNLIKLKNLRLIAKYIFFLLNIFCFGFSSTIFLLSV